MSDICFEGLKILVMVAVLVLTRYVLPWVKSKADSEKLNLVAQWAYKAVLMAQQTMKATDGKEKKAIVTQFLKELLQEKNIALSDTQIEILIEAAVKQMKIQCRLPRYLTKPRQRRNEWDMAGSDGISRVSAVFRGKSLLTNKMRII